MHEAMQIKCGNQVTYQTLVLFSPRRYHYSFIYTTMPSSDTAVASAETSVYGRANEGDAEDDDGGKALAGRGANKDDLEVTLLKEIRLALSSMLHMLETCKENLILLGLRIDKLRDASEKCRIVVQEQQRLRRFATSPNSTGDTRIPPATDG